MIVEKLGWGKYSDVHKVINYKTGEKFALKIISKQGLSEDELKILFNEAKIMEVLRHKNIIKLFEAKENYQTF